MYVWGVFGLYVFFACDVMLVSIANATNTMNRYRFITHLFKRLSIAITFSVTIEESSITDPSLLVPDLY